MTPAEALALLDDIAALRPADRTVATRDDALDLLDDIAALRSAAASLVVAIEDEEDRAICAAREVLRDYGDRKLIADRLARSPAHVSNVVREGRRAAPVPAQRAG